MTWDGRSVAAEELMTVTSKSGVGTLIGNTSAHISAFGVRVSGGRTCSKSNEKTPSHNC